MPVSQSSARSRAFRGLVAAFTLSSVGFSAMAPFLIIWAHRDAGLGGAAAGLLFVAQAAGELMGGLAGGLLADRLGARRVLLVSLSGMALAYGFLAVTSQPAVAVVTIFIGGLFEAAFHPTAFALVGDLTNEKEAIGAFGLLRAGGNLGRILGPLAGAAIISGAPIAEVFLLTAGLLAVSAIVVRATLPGRGLTVSLEEEAEEIQAAVPGVKAIFGDRRLALLVGAGALLAITLEWWEADGLVILQRQRLFGTSTFAIMIAITAAITVVLQIPVSRWSQTRPTGRVLALGAILQAAGLALLAAASIGLGIIVAAVVLIALGQMFYGPTVSALISRIAPSGRSVTYQAAMSTAVDIGTAAGPASGLAIPGARLIWLLAVPLGALAAGAGLHASQDDVQPPGLPPRESANGEPTTTTLTSPSKEQ